MNRITDWWNRSSEALAALMERPWLFAAVLLALRSLVRPYLGLVHDAKLYSLQVASHMWPGTYDTDLFFAFGSQDGWSVFSRLMAPLSAAIGLELSFFVVWLASTAAIILAEVLLVRRLIESRPVAAVAMVLLAVTDVAYGGMQVFHVHEPFLTARLPAVALVLFAFTQLLDRRFAFACVLLVAAMVMHPLMAVPGLFVGGATIASAGWKTEKLAIIGLAVAAAGAAVALIPAIGERLFGRMDGEWLRITKDICAQCFVSLWSANEWCRTSIALIIVVAVRGYLPEPVGRLTFWVAFTAFGGLAATAYAEWAQYAFLIQGQAFRALWLVEHLAYPLGLYLITRLWQEEVGKKVLAIPVAAYVMQPIVHGSMQGEVALEAIGLWVISSLSAAAFFYAWARGRDQKASLGAAVLVGMLGMSLFMSGDHFRRFLFSADFSKERISLLWWWGGHAVSVAVIASAGTLGLDYVVRRLGAGWRSASIATCAWLVVASLPFYLDSLRIGEQRFGEGDRDIAFVKSFVASQSRNGPPHVYWPSDPSRIWFDLRGISYFSWYQTWGIIFSKDLAETAAPRALAACRFEVDWMRESGAPEEQWEIPLGMLQADFSEPPPQREDLLKVAQEPTLDWIVTKHRFDGLPVAENGAVYIYDARKLRESAEFAARTP